MTGDVLLQGEPWNEELDQGVWLEHVEQDDLRELVDVDLSTSRDGDVVDAQVAHDLKGEEETPEVFNSSFEEDLKNQLEEHENLQCF